MVMMMIMIVIIMVIRWRVVTEDDEMADRREVHHGGIESNT